MPSLIRNIVLALLLLFMADGKLRAQTATTGAATTVGDLSATLTGTFDPAGGTFWVYFQWGTDTSYGHGVEANPSYFSTGIPAQPVTLTATGLLPNTTYHYRLIGERPTDFSPSVLGQDMTFTTGPPATAPSINGTVSCLQLQKEHLLLMVPNVFAGAAQTALVVEYGLTTDYGSSQTVATLPLANYSGGDLITVGGLTPNTTYHVRAKATSTLGTVVTPDATFTTLTPAVLATGAATGVTDLSANLNATLTQNGNYLNEMFFEYGTSTSYGGIHQVYGTGVDPQAISQAVTDLLPNTVYHFRFTAYDWEDGEISGNDQTFTTAAAATAPMITNGVSVRNNTPTVVSASVSNIFSGSSPATVILEYGLTTAYGSVVQVPGPIPTNTSTPVEDSITGLQPGTTYHVRCTATNAQGSVSTTDTAFTTLPAPVLTTLAATGVTDLNAVLNGTANAQGADITVEFEWGTDINYGHVQQVAANISGTTTYNESATPYGLLPSTTYHYRIRAYDGNNVHYFGQDMTFTTLAAATPPTLGTVSPYSIGTTEAYVQCYPIFAGSSPATVYFDYGPTTAYGSTVTYSNIIPTNGEDEGLVTLNGLSMLTTYHVRCRVVNNEGTATSADATFATYGIPVVTTGPATNVTDLSATLNGSILANGPSTTAYAYFEIGTDTNYGSTFAANPSSILSSELTPFTGTPPGLLPNTTYHYRAWVYYAFNGLYFYGPDATFTTAAPATPPTVSAAFTDYVSDNSAGVEASTVTAGSSNATVIWEFGPTTAYGSSINSNPVAIPLGGSNGASAVFTGLAPGTTYHYRCTATNAQGSASSADATFTTMLAPVLTTSPLYTATDLTATLNGSATLNGNFFTGFYFEWGTDTTYGSQTSVFASGIGDPQTISGTATGLLPNTTYHYRIKGETTDNVWYYGQDQTLTTGAPNTAPTVSSGNAITLTTTSVSLNVYSLATGSSAATLSYDYGPDATYGTTVVYPTPLPLSQTFNIFNNSLPVTITGLTPGTTYHFRARAVNSEGNSVGQDATFTTAVAPVLATAAATNVSTVCATLNGTLQSNGVQYTASFDYGPTTDYGSNINALSFGVINGGGLINLGTLNTTVATNTVNTGTTLTLGTTANTGIIANTGTILTVGTTVNTGVNVNTGLTFTTGTTLNTGIIVNTGTTLNTGITLTAGTTGAGTIGLVKTGTGILTLGNTTSAGSGSITVMSGTLIVEGEAITGSSTINLNGGTLVLNTGTIATTTANGVVTLSWGTTTGSHVINLNGGALVVNGQTITTTGDVMTLSGGTGTITVTSTSTGGTTTSTTTPNATPAPPDGTDTSTTTGDTSSGAITITEGGYIYGNGNAGTILGRLGGGIITIGNPNQPAPEFANLTGLTPNTTIHYRLKATDTAGNSYYGNDMTLTTIGPDAVAQNWRQEYFNSPDNSGPASDMASPSGDGIPNLLKYALGLDPNVSSTGIMPQPVLKDYNGVTYLSYVFQRDASMTDLTYTVEGADSPAGPWTPVASSVGGAPTTGPGFVTENMGIGIGTLVFPLSPTTTYTVEVRDVVSTADAPRRFLRLQVTRP